MVRTDLQVLPGRLRHVQVVVVVLVLQSLHVGDVLRQRPVLSGARGLAFVADFRAGFEVFG